MNDSGRHRALGLLSLAATAFASSALALAACGGGTEPVDATDSGTDATTSSDGATTARDGATSQGDSAATTDGGTTSTDSGTKDSAPANDGSFDPGERAADAAVFCGSSTCTAGQVCCGSYDPDAGLQGVCATSCTDGAAPVACDGPEDCTGSTKTCCGTVKLGAGSIPDCPIAQASSACRATCQSQVPFSCPGTATIKACQAPADCAGDTQGYTTCCEFTFRSITQKFCANALIKNFASRCL
ncbi:MAG: hypothetical protein U0169_21580 [Polyangiaceae bacterium]